MKILQLPVNCGSIHVFIDEHKVMMKDEQVNLSPREYKLLLFLIENKNKVLSRKEILGDVITFSVYTRICLNWFINFMFDLCSCYVQGIVDQKYC
ncbi:winged helix-turn-helix domain-containing protein [Flavobacterium sp. 7A]|uniref:winged helix-turn-helix domain-containing protein n=1 Tax=Flavobacterium sp. 7A TaxID=2940571 RepID=UPI002227AFE7|nr:winged helix-turn-helix domain-containing protein [Flavobacterium sp. 7A]MCW2118440.1 DNA-binding response OmpR family regulator [Flavobacterium sp. 7A]